MIEDVFVAVGGAHNQGQVVAQTHKGSARVFNKWDDPSVRSIVSIRRLFGEYKS